MKRVPYFSPYVLSHNEIYKVLQQQLQNLLKLTTTTDFDLQQELYEKVYTSWYQRNQTQPDHVFYSHWNQLKYQYKDSKSWSLTVFSPIANYYFDKGDKISIKTPCFDEWQTFVSNNTALPVLANKITHFKYESSTENAFELLHLLQDKLGYRPYLTPDEPLLDNFICQSKLYETHMHLNGTSSFEQNWYDTLLRPEEFIEKLQISMKNKQKVKLLYATHPYLKSLNDYYQLILLARHLREYLLAWRSENGDTTNRKIQELKTNIAKIISNDTVSVINNFEYEKAQFGISSCEYTFTEILLDIATHDSYVKELHWHIQVQQKLRTQPSEYPDIAYLLYVVCMNTMQRLFVQRDDQYGFDNFQKFADDNARELAEQVYTDRFFQLHGPHRNYSGDMAVIEGRFAPKKTADDNMKLIKQICLGFLEYNYKISKSQNEVNYSDCLSTLVQHVSRQPIKLYLVAHFIKNPEKAQESFSFASLRNDFWLKANILVNLIKDYPNLGNIIKAVDAAANELDTPPEVLAPIFRYCRHQGIKHFTYHVGEDFEHLISGIRAIYEAIEFLPLQNGDRIGHATAIGILPKLWLKNTPTKILLKKGEWLDNLLFIWQMILTHHLKGFNLLELENHIHRLYFEIYDGVTMTGNKGNTIKLTDFNLNLIYLAYSYRYLDPEKVITFLNEEYISLRDSEYQHLKKLNIRALQLAKVTWFDNEVREKRKKLLELDISFTPKQLLKLQQCVQKMIADKKIIIESLLTSNVRISHYKSIHEHHIFRWLHIKDRAIDGDAKMRIVLGSDDPGIFATDLRGEYYHLFCSLKSHFGYSEDKSLESIKKIHENSQVYHFSGGN